jgi:DNA-binding MarR family transcriptional regulator
VARVIATHPGIRQSDVARKLGIARSTLHRHIRALEGAGIIKRDGRALEPAEVLAVPPGPAQP